MMDLLDPSTVILVSSLITLVAFTLWLFFGEP
jgi:hypothetical protein